MNIGHAAKLFGIFRESSSRTPPIKYIERKKSIINRNSEENKVFIFLYFKSNSEKSSDNRSNLF